SDCFGSEWIVFGHSGRLISAVGTPHRLSVLFGRFKWRLADTSVGSTPYNGEDKPLGGVTYGGYSESIVVDEGFVLKVSENLNLAAVGTAAVRRNQDLFA